MAWNIVLKTYRTSGRYFASHCTQIKIGGVLLKENLQNKFLATTCHSVNKDKTKLRATGVAQFYYIRWKGWRTRLKLRFARTTCLVINHNNIVVKVLESMGCSTWSISDAMPAGCFPLWLACEPL